MPTLRGAATVVSLMLLSMSARSADAAGLAGPMPSRGGTMDAAASIALTVGTALVDPPRRRYVVAAIGDSLTDSRVGGGLFLKVLRRLCPLSRFDGYGVGGQRTDHMRWRFDRDVFGAGLPGGRAHPEYTHVLILGGVNDLASAPIRGARIGRIERNLSLMYSRARRRGVSVVALTLPPWMGRSAFADARVDATNDLNAWILAQRPTDPGFHAVDIRPVLACPDGTLCPALRRFPDDPVHWGPRGHEAVARLLRRELFADCL